MLYLTTFLDTYTSVWMDGWILEYFNFCSFIVLLLFIWLTSKDLFSVERKASLFFTKKGIFKEFAKIKEFVLHHVSLLSENCCQVSHRCMALLIECAGYQQSVSPDREVFVKTGALVASDGADDHQK